MQGHAYQNNVRIPYSKWSQHRADNGLIYLAHPVTGEVKWLWSRHHDPKTSRDYLVNTITGDRHWVTEQNEHLCPIRPRESSPSTGGTSQASSGPVSTNPFSNLPKESARAHTLSSREQSKAGHVGYREIEAPKSLGLTADEVLMLKVDTGRRYIYNKKTRSSRWLPDRPPDTISSESSSKGLFGRNKNAKTRTSPLEDGPSDWAEVRQKGATASAQEPSSKEVPLPSQNARSAAASATHGAPVTSANAGGRRGTRTETSHLKDASKDLPSSHGQPRMGTTSHTTQPQRSMNGHAPAHLVYSSEEAALIIQRILRGGAIRQSNVLGKLQELSDALQSVRDLTTSGKYDMKRLRGIAEGDGSSEEKEEASQRLLELGEYLTQQMLKVDDVESAGNQVIRAKRKTSVNAILSLHDEVDSLRKNLPVKRS